MKYLNLKCFKYNFHHCQNDADTMILDVTEKKYECMFTLGH